MKAQQLAVQLILALSLTPAAFGQGETCADPVMLSGLGAFPFDTTGFASSNFEEQGGCTVPSGPGETFAGDGFFRWTVPADGDYQFVAEGDAFGVDWDVQLALYSGTDCGSSCLAADDDTGPNRQALIGLSGLTAGTELLMQVGGYDFFNNGNPTRYDGPGTLYISERPSECQNTVDDSLEDNDTCEQSISIAPGTYTSQFLSIEDPDFFAVTIPVGLALNVELLRSDLPLNFFVYDSTCALIDIVSTVRWIRPNATGAPERIVIQPMRSNLADAIPCTTYDWRLTLATEPCLGALDDAFEENDFSNTPAPIADGVYRDLFITAAVNSTGLTERDYYAIRVGAGDRAVVRLDFRNELANVDALLLGPTGNILAAGTSTTDNERLTWTHSGSGTAEIRLLVYVAAPGSQLCNRYDLVVDTDRKGLGGAGLARGQLGGAGGGVLHAPSDLPPRPRFVPKWGTAGRAFRHAVTARERR